MSNDELPNIQRTNIKVCVRVRPQIITGYSSPIFSTKKRIGRQSGIRQRLFQDKQDHPSHARSTGTPVPQDRLISDQKDVLSWNVKGNTIAQAETTNPDYTRSSSYTVDEAFDGNTRTKQVYLGSIRPIVMASLQGYHGSVFAYGQTSTGKTYTMQGNKLEPGIVPLAVHDCFRYISENTDHHREFLLRVSYMEIYNEQINDLLHPGSTSSSSIRIFENKTEGIIIKGLKEEVVVSPQQVFALIAAGEAQRHVGATSMNEHSSRSHTIFRMLIESKDLRASGKSRSGMSEPVRVSSLSLVDLAGSECIKNTGATGQRKAEGQYINKSLATLGHVVWKLSEISRTGTSEHIPYRDSKLTRLLQPSLSGNAQVAIVCTISPSLKHIDESHNTLKFATRAKRIKQEATVNEVIDENTLIQQYQEEIANLKKRLEELENEKVKGREDYDDDDDFQETILAAIHNLERLILKTRVGNEAITPFTEQNLVMDDNFSIHVNPPILSTPLGKDDDDEGQGVSLENELQSLKGLLGSVLKKKDSNDATPMSVRKIQHINETIQDTLSFQTDSTDLIPTQSENSSDQDKEMLRLKHLLNEYEVQASLRKADSDFLQQKLNEKEKLLLEVADVLERVESKQRQLEEENNRLHDELELTKRLLSEQTFSKA